LIETIERYYDLVPRASARVETIGPFTLFVQSQPGGWPFYARPTLGGDATFTPEQVDRVRTRQAELGVPQAFEWVDEVTPELLPVAEASGLAVTSCPLLVLDRRSTPPDGPVPGVDVRVLEADDPMLADVVGAVGAAFSGHDEVVAPDPGNWPDIIGRGLSRLVGAFVQGRPVGGGSHSPRGGVSELTGIGVLPSYRQRGVGALITAGLAADAESRGTETVFLSARDDDAARVYQRQGFVRVATACLAEPR
jgi:ribosomal protein S18 acetylase RimI-like enzyme